MLDITTLAAWGEFIGGIAVVVSLVYLAGQIRQNSKLLRASSTASTSELMLSQNDAIIQDADVARFFFEGMADSNSQHERGLRWQVQQPGIQQWWREFAEVSFGAEFIEYVDGLIREGEAAE